MASPDFAAGFSKSVTYSLHYLWRWFLVSCIPMILAGLIAQRVEVSGFIFVHNFVAIVILLPGAVICNLAALKHWPDRRWTRPERPAWIAAFTSISVTWLGYGGVFVIGSLSVGASEGFILGGLFTSLVGGSTLGLLAAWNSAGVRQGRL